MKFIAIEGNIGARKKQFLTFLQTHFKHVSIIRQEKEQQLLKQYLKEPKNYSFLYEMNNLITKHKSSTLILNQIENINDHNNNNILLTNRSHHSSLLFMKAYLELEYIDQKQYEIFNYMYNLMSFFQYDAIIYLKSDINKCFDRLIEQQNNLISFDLIETLHQKYEEWIQSMTNTKILIIDMEKYIDLETNEKTQHLLTQIILSHFDFFHKKKLKKENEWTVVKYKHKKNKNAV